MEPTNRSIRRKPARAAALASLLVLAGSAAVPAQAPGNVFTAGSGIPIGLGGKDRVMAIVNVGTDRIIVCAGLNQPSTGVKQLVGEPLEDGEHGPDDITVLNDAASGQNAPHQVNRCWMAVDGTGRVHVIWGVYEAAYWQQYYNWWEPTLTTSVVGTPIALSPLTGATNAHPTTAMEMVVDQSDRVWMAVHQPILSGGIPVQGAGLMRLSGGVFSAVGPPVASGSVRNLSLAVDAAGYVHNLFVTDGGQIRHRVFAPDNTLGSWVSVSQTLVAAPNDPDPFCVVAADPVGGPQRGWVDCMLVTRGTANGPRQYRHRRWTPTSGGNGTWGPPESFSEETVNSNLSSDGNVLDLYVDDDGTMWIVHRDDLGNQNPSPLKLTRKTSAVGFSRVCEVLDDDGGFGIDALWNPVFVRGAPVCTGSKPLHIEWRKGPAAGPYQTRYFQGPYPVVGAPGDVVINEFSYDDDGTDDQEFVELYNAGTVAINLQGWTLSNEDSTGLAIGSPITFGAGVVLGTGQFFVVGNAAVPVPAGVMHHVAPPGWLENNNESIVLRHPVGAVIDAVGYEVDAGPVPFREALGIWGDLLTSTAGSQLSHARWQDGRDTQDNGADFGRLPRSPGAPNRAAPAAALPYSENFDGLAVESVPPGWAGSLALPKVVDPTSPSVSLPNAVPASPQGGNCLALFVPANSGTMALLDTVAGSDFDLDLWAYLHAGHIGTDAEEWSIGIRGTSDGLFRMPVGDALDRNGNTGYSFTYRTESSGGVLHLAAHGSGGFLNKLQTIQVTPGTNDGWRRLRLASLGPNLIAEFGGTPGVIGSGVVFTSLECLHPARIGQVYLGYRSSLGATASARPLLVDGVMVSVPQPLYQVNQPLASMDVNGSIGTAFTKATTGLVPGVTGFLNILGPPSSPFDGFFAPAPLVPYPAALGPSPGGQLINVPLFFGGIWLSGGSAPTFLLLPPTGAVSIPIFTPPGLTGLVISTQAVVLTPMHVEGAALTQGVEIVFY